MDLQALMDGMSKRWAEERSQSQMTLGRLISGLEQVPPDFMIEKLEKPRSYRGYYQDLSFGKGDGMMKASDLLAMCRNCMGEVFTGYKGGEYVMGAKTALWIAEYGCTGEKFMTILPNGVIETAPDES